MKFLEGLQERKSEIEDELAAVKPLMDELAMIDQLLTKHEKGAVEPSLFSPMTSETRSPHRFEPDPNSYTSRILDETRRVLEAAPHHELSFLKLYHAFPASFNGSGKARERARTAIMRAGKRAGIEYVNRQRVRLVT